MDGRSPVQNATHAVEALYNTIPIAGTGQFTIAIGAEADDPISLELGRGHYPGAYQSILGMQQQSVPPGGRVLGLGAFIGCFSLGAAVAGYQVVAVEASPRNAALLNDSIQRNGFTNMRLVNTVVSDRAGTLEFHSFGPYGHVCSPSSVTRGLEIPCITVDDLLQQLG